MHTKNTCYTYFKIVGDFDPDVVTKCLGLMPEKSWRIGDRRKNGTLYDFAMWMVGRVDDYDVMVANQMRKTIEVLQDKIDVLCQIRKTYNVSFYLEVVPSVYEGEISPCLAPPLDIIDFCHATRTEIDIDLYVLESQDE